MIVKDVKNILVRHFVNTKLDELVEENKKILFGFNLANDFTHVAKIMNENGLKADMLLRPISEGGSSLMSDPKWEDPDYEYDIIWWNFSKNKWKKMLMYADTVNQFMLNRLGNSFPAKTSRNYDLVMSTPPTLYFHGHKNLIIYDGGMARILPVHPTLRSRLITKGYLDAKRVIYTNPDMRPLFSKIKLNMDKLSFIPFAIDFERYKPVKTEENNRFTLFMYSRVDFRIKGSDHILFALKEVIDEYPDVLLIVTEWGNDLIKFKELVKKLNLSKNVKFVDLVPKQILIQRIQKADVCVDQFVIGSYGTACPEAMSCEKVVLINLNNDAYRRDFGGDPPIANCRSVKEITKEVIKLIDDQKYHKELGKKARKWIINKHNPYDVLNKKIDIIYEVLQ